MTITELLASGAGMAEIIASGFSPADVAREIRRLALMAVDYVPDERADEFAPLIPEWEGSGITYEAGRKIRFNGLVYTILITHVSQPDWTPEDAPSLFARKLTSENPDEILEWVQPDSTNPYMKGDKVSYNGDIWESEIDNNVWAPGVYGWKKI